MRDMQSAFVAFNDAGSNIFGSAPKLELLFENDAYPFAHEAGIFISDRNEVFITSNQFIDPATGKKKIQVTKVVLPTNDGEKATCEEIDTPGILMANGGVNYKDGMIFCAQGSLDSPGGIVYMESVAPYHTEVLVDSFYGRPFNSVNDVVVHSDGSVWFTDPTYGFEQEIRPPPQLPSQVYRFDPKTKSIRAMADGFGHPNGISFSPDEKIVYVTDTDAAHDGRLDPSRVASMYVFTKSPRRRREYDMLTFLAMPLI